MYMSAFDCMCVCVHAHVHVCACMYACTCIHTYGWVHMWRPEVEAKYFPQLLSTLLFETRVLTEPGNQQALGTLLSLPLNAAFGLQVHSGQALHPLSHSSSPKVVFFHWVGSEH